MKRTVSPKTIIPVILLIAVMIALAVVAGYAFSLKSSSVDRGLEILPATPVPDGTSVLRTAVPATPSPAPTIEPILAADPDASDTSETDPVFWSDGILFVADTYRSPTLSVTVSTISDSTTFKKNLVYYVADIHVTDVTQIRTACPSGDFNRRGRGDFASIAKRENALVAVSGDFCPALVIRNGEVYRTTIGNGDICLLLRNGEMTFMRSSEASMRRIQALDPWQAWQFGPVLTDESGNPLKSFPDSKIGDNNPRCCLGYYEPGHYCFVVVDGRHRRVSEGLKMTELSQLMVSLGCKQAYNLDGGASAHFFWKDAVLNHPSGGGRYVGDIVYIAKEPYSTSPFYRGKAGLPE